MRIYCKLVSSEKYKLTALYLTSPHISIKWYTLTSSRLKIMNKLCCRMLHVKDGVYFLEIIDLIFKIKSKLFLTIVMIAIVMIIIVKQTCQSRHKKSTCFTFVLLIVALSSYSTKRSSTESMTFKIKMSMRKTSKR